MKGKKIVLATIMAVVVAFALQSCKKDGSTDTGQVAVKMTDAPAVYDAVYVDVTGVEVNSDVSGWVTMGNVHAGVYNLLDLANGNDTLLATADLPVGNISQIRLILGSNNSVVANGVTYALNIPSGSESGLKINIHQDVTANANNVILIDFDAGASIHQTGAGDFKLQPVIRAIVATTGSVSGSVFPAVMSSVYVVSGNDTITTTTNVLGQFVLQGVLPGSYNLTIQPSGIIYSAVTVNNVSIAANTNTNIGVVNL
jgi:hypothetical protein